MIRVSNKACVRHLGRQSMKAAKTRNCIAVLAIALTTVLFTSLFTIALSINDGFQQSNFRQAGGYNHATFKSLTQEQFGEIKEDPLIKEWGLRRFIGMPTEAPFHKSHVEIGYSDQTQAKWMFFQPQEGHVGHFFIFNVAAGRFAQLLRRGCTIQYIVNDLKTQA